MECTSALARTHNAKIEPQPTIIKQEPGDTWEVSWTSSGDMKAIPCVSCNFLGLPKVLRLHQLLGCCGVSVNASNMRDSLPNSLLMTLKPFTIKLETSPIAGGSEVKTLINSHAACDMCSFIAQPKMLRIHQLLGCRATILDMKKYKPIKMETSLRTKKISRTKEKPVSCNICNYKCSKLSQLKRHNLIHTKEKKFSCDKCTFKCSIATNLQKHALTHTEEKPYSCNICNYKSNLLSCLRIHKYTHTRDKPFSCDKCTYKCTTSYYLKKHAVKHTGDKPFSCKICSYSCTQLKYLKQHASTHTEEKPYSCDICDYKCSQLRYLKQHNATHTGVKPFSCEKCTHKSATAYLLKKHSVTHTKYK